MDGLICIVCGDDRDVRNHYGVASCFGCKAFFRRTINENKLYICNKFGTCIIDKVSRNKCRACRFDKCKKLGMKEEKTDVQHIEKLDLRDTRKNDLLGRMEDSPDQVRPEMKSKFVPKEETLNDTSKEKQRKSLNFIEFLSSMNKVCNDDYDPRFAYVTEEDIIEMDSTYGRHIKLEDAIQQPELVAPRTKLRWTYERPFKMEDLSHSWYRLFVSVADFANLIPQFRQLSIDDKCLLFRLNFSNLSWIYNLDDLIDDNLEIGFPLGNGSYVPWEFIEHAKNGSLFSPNSLALDDFKNFILKNFKDPFRSINIDEKEICLLKTILLFQFEENLSEKGQGICHRMNDLLIDTLWDYQGIRYPDMSFDEKLRRHSRFLLLIPKIGQAWHMESDIHLLMSVFGEVNIDGVVKELLFYNSNFKSDH